MEAYLTARVFNRVKSTNFLLKASSPVNPRLYRSSAIVRCALINPPSSRPINLFLSLSSSHLSNPYTKHNNSRSFQSKSKDGVFSWHPASETEINGDRRLLGPRDPATTVVLLGWLGAKQKHLRKYVEWYNSLGFHAITFVVEVGELLRFDLGERVERRVSALANELIDFLGKEDGREHCLLFHSFSNTGFLTYGYILDILQGRDSAADKVRGCIIDSGGAGLLDHKVWAAGFAAAILQKRSSAPQIPEEEAKNRKDSYTKPSDDKPDAYGTFVLGALEMFFAVVLKFPDVDRQLQKIVAAVAKNQPSYPHLYMYSAGDKVVPHEAIEAAIQEELKKGRKVVSHNFGSSPHVDHYRTFPEQYLSVLSRFLKECLSNVKVSSS
ncbi:Transmembrane protein 53-B [Linum perenne]